MVPLRMSCWAVYVVLPSDPYSEAVKMASCVHVVLPTDDVESRETILVITILAIT